MGKDKPIAKFNLQVIHTYISVTVQSSVHLTSSYKTEGKNTRFKVIRKSYFSRLYLLWEASQINNLTLPGVRLGLVYSYIQVCIQHNLASRLEENMQPDQCSCIIFCCSTSSRKAQKFSDNVILTDQCTGGIDVFLFTSLPGQSCPLDQPWHVWRCAKAFGSLLSHCNSVEHFASVYSERTISVARRCSTKNICNGGSTANVKFCRGWIGLIELMQLFQSEEVKWSQISNTVIHPVV